MKRWRQVGLDLPGQKDRIKKKAGRPWGRTTVERVRRPPVDRRNPVLVTLKARKGAPALRRAHAWAVLRAAFRRACDRFGFRLVHFAVEGNHIHLICEALDKRALSRGVQGLSIRIARRMNRLAGRHGKFFADRYHSSNLDSPTKVRNALRYVLLNTAHHEPLKAGLLDVYSSGPYFDGWKERLRLRILEDGDPPCVPPTSWVLRTGWRRAGGPISRNEVPGATAS
jgi:REP element-mobilizing transposase RayT